MKSSRALLSGASHEPNHSPDPQGSDGAVDAHVGTWPRVKIKSLTPFSFAVAIVPSMVDQSYWPAVGSSIAQYATSQKRKV